jgi:hypothetical protein
MGSHRNSLEQFYIQLHNSSNSSSSSSNNNNSSSSSSSKKKLISEHHTKERTPLLEFVDDLHLQHANM